MARLADTLPSLATARDLVAFHAARARFYRAVAILLTDSPGARKLETAHALLAGSPRNWVGHHERELLGLLETARLEEISGDALAPRGPISGTCRRPAAPTRLRACHAADVAPSGDRVCEILMLGVLAERTAKALAAADMVGAAATSDLQADLLREHTGACVGGFALELARSPIEFFAALGRALGQQLEEDLLLFEATPGAGSPERAPGSSPGGRGSPG